MIIKEEKFQKKLKLFGKMVNRMIVILIMLLKSIILLDAQSMDDQPYVFRLQNGRLFIQIEITPINDTVFCVKHMVSNDYSVPVYVSMVNIKQSYIEDVVPGAGRDLYISLAGSQFRWIRIDYDVEVLKIPPISQKRRVSYCRFLYFKNVTKIQWLNIEILYALETDSLLSKMNYLRTDNLSCGIHNESVDIYSINVNDYESLFKCCAIYQKNVKLFR